MAEEDRYTTVTICLLMILICLQRVNSLSGQGYDRYTIFWQSARLR